MNVHNQNRFATITSLREHIQIGEVQAGVAMGKRKVRTRVMVRHRGSLQSNFAGHQMSTLGDLKANRVHVDEMGTGDEPSVVGLFRGKHGIRRVPTLEIRWYLRTIFRACE